MFQHARVEKQRLLDVQNHEKRVAVYSFHPDNKEKTGAIPSFSELPKKYLRYPDFMKDNVIADAKYKNMLKPVPTSRHYYEYIQRA